MDGNKLMTHSTAGYEQNKRKPLLRSAAIYIACLSLAIMCFGSSAVAQTPAPPNLTASEIVAKMAMMNQKRAEALKSFTSHRTYDLEYNGFPSHKKAKMEVNVVFTAPRDKQLTIVSEDGSELLRKRVLRKLVESELEASARDNQSSTALTEANYEFALQGTEQKDGRECYILDVKARSKSKFLYDGRVWVDATDFAVVHIQAHPAKNPSFWIKSVEIEHQYVKVGPFWLPASNKSTSATRLGGHAVLAIDYGTYKVQPDLPSNSEQSMNLFSLK